MGVEAAEVQREEPLEELARPLAISRRPPIERLENRIRVHVVGIGAGDHQLHLEHRPLSPGDDRPRPLVDGLSLLPPALLLGIPFAQAPEREGNETELGGVEPYRRHRAREVRMPRVGPLLRRRDRDDRARDLVAHGRPQRDLARSPQ